MDRIIEEGSKWLHFKGIEIEVITIGKDVDTIEELIVYSHDGEVWIRKKSEFLSEVDHNKYPDVKQKYRFERIG